MIPRYLPSPEQPPSSSPLRLLAALLAGLLLPAAALAQPSGGPYGPLQQRYEIPSANRVYYVAPDGRADADGASLDRPSTLEAVLPKVVTGDAIILRGGTYRTGGLELNQGITMQPYLDERPVLKGTQVATEWVAQSNGLWRTSWQHLFPAEPADWWRRERQARQTPLYLFNNDMVFIDGELLSAVGGEHELHEKAFYIDYAAGQVYLATDPTNRQVEITAHDSALIRTIRDVHGKKNDRKGVIVRGLTFTQYAYRAIEVEGTEPTRHMDPSEFGKEVVGSRFEHVTISYCSRVAGYFRGDQTVFRHCLISDCGTEGLYVVDSADVLLERNIVTRTNSAEKISGYFASAIKIFNQSYRVVVRDNLIIDNPYASGIWYDVGNVDGLVVNNWVERTNDGFFFEISKGAICAGNVFVNCTPGVRVLNSSDVHLYQNTFYNSVASFERNERSAVADHFGWHPSAGPDVHERHGHIFVNNLLAADESFTQPLVRFYQSEKVRDRLKDPQVKEFDGNVYVRRAGPKSGPLISWGPVDNESGTIAVTELGQLHKVQPKFETKAQVFADYRGPLFRGVELGHFELLQAFPGANGGLPLPARIREPLGWPEGAPFPGAYAPRD